MENSSSNYPNATPTEAPVRDSAENVGPAGRRAETPWNSRDRQREFGALDADIANRTAPKPPVRPVKPVEPTPTWPIAVAVIAVLGIGVGLLLRHGASGAPASTTTNATNITVSPLSASKQPPVVESTKPKTPTKKPIANNPVKQTTIVHAVATPAAPVAIVKPPTVATPAPRSKSPRTVIVRATPEPRRPTRSEKPLEARPRPVASKAPVIAIATPRPVPHHTATPKPQAPTLHLPSSNGDDSEINDKANKLLGGG